MHDHARKPRIPLINGLESRAHLGDPPVHRVLPSQRRAEQRYFRNILSSESSKNAEPEKGEKKLKVCFFPISIFIALCL